MAPESANRFQEFFEDRRYVALKNHLYNYRLRKRAVERQAAHDGRGLVLELGSGLSPMMTGDRRVVYSDPSWLALHTLRQTQPGWYVVADGTRLPFKSGAFDRAVCSEVLEHLADDRAAIRELARVMTPSGRLVVTVPHRKCYFAIDDRFVHHLRRYELSEFEERLRAAGLRAVLVQKVLGPLEKATMCAAVVCFSLVRRAWPDANREPRRGAVAALPVLLFKWANRLYAGLAWLDARLMPRALAATLLIAAEKEPGAGRPEDR
jgi:SAM-dependent methyltransferase